MPLAIEDSFAGYRVLRLLGSGGMGQVYLVQHPRLPRQEALKVLRPELSQDGSFRERFIREADLASGIVGIHDRGEYEGQLWIAMDYIDGTDLAELLGQRYPQGMPVGHVLPIVTAVAGALDYAHKKGLLHRDVKPANIIVADLDADDPKVFLADFGIARPLDDTSGITTTNMAVGTVAYAAPEQLMGEPMDGRADQYALAATTYHLLTGSQLFPNSNPAVVISRHLNAPVPVLAEVRPELASLDPILAAALAKDPDDRYASSTDFARALAGHTSGVVAAPTVYAKAPRRPDPATDAEGSGDQNDTASSVSRRPIGILVAAVLLIMLVVAGILWRPWQHPQPDASAVSSSIVPTSLTLPTTTSAPVSTSASAAPDPPPTSTVAAPTVIRTPTVYAPNDERPNIEGADWASYDRALGQGMSAAGVEKMRGIVWTDSAAWVCDWDKQGANQAAVEDRLVDKYDDLSYQDASVIYRSAMDWVCPTAAHPPAPSIMPSAASNPNGPGCSAERPEKCGPWTPEQAAFACRAVAGGADYTEDLKHMLINRYGLDDNSAFFLGKEAWYSVSSGGYINTGSMADGPHPLCNDIIP
ncbi:serine/threonine-protein kinase [Mycolicibacterium diernhoferi]|uniref:serine/threonine-protein kinase n=1 Tax=Mycolicibacterium diernhoferi TaxID=1801 RepID=UPI0021F34195|nr:serine/threonine-protein kinase [Mycolicibacterium diernhoferi]